MLFVVVTVSLFLSVLVLAASAFIAKRHALADFRKLPGQKPSVLFGNALQLEGEADGKFIKVVSNGFACYSSQMNISHHLIILFIGLVPAYRLALELNEYGNKNVTNKIFCCVALAGDRRECL